MLVLFFTILYFTKQIKQFVRGIIIAGIGMAMMKTEIIQILAIYIMLQEPMKNFLEQVMVVEKDMY